jgi:HSP20 family molecular chaperone IbpA
MNREVHVRFWERAEVKSLRATRQNRRLPRPQQQRPVHLNQRTYEDKVSAGFKNGVVTVTMPKAPQAQSKVKRIAVNGK